jgi:hypothetical protein
MRSRVPVIALIILSLLAASPAWAQQHVTSPSDLRAAMLDKAAADDARRQLVRAVLRHDLAQQVADRFALDLTQAERAVATLDGEELASVAASARFVDAHLSGEASTITISLTTLLLVIIIIILLAN